MPEPAFVLIAANTSVTIAIVVAVFLFGWWLLRPRFDFVITVSQGTVTCRGSLPESKLNSIKHFLSHDVQFDQPVKICGRRQPNGRFRLQFHGEVGPGTQQQIRNYLLTVL